jgi:WXXGXW repeat (2 copies)
MRRSIIVLLFAVLIAGMGALQHHLGAQAVGGEAPFVSSPTYLSIPPAQQEVITASPSPQYVWVSGQWERTPDNWSWNAGSWVQPPFSNAYWVLGYWKHHGGQYVWQPAHWGAAPQGVVVNKPIAVPPAYEEVQPPAPATANMLWQPGHWAWRGTWVWVPGEYVQSTSPRATWVMGQWVAGSQGNWLWSPAHWVVS